MSFQKNIVVLLFVLLGWSKIGFADGKIDSMIAVLPNITDTVEKIKTLNRICFEISWDDPETAYFFGRKALNLGETIADVKLQSSSLNRLAIAYEYDGDYDSALYYYKRAYTFADSAGALQQKCNVLNNLGYLYGLQSRYDKAFESLIECIRCNEESGDKDGVASGYENIGVNYLAQNDPEKAKEYLFEALAVYKELDDDYSISDAYLNIAIAYEKAMQYDSSIYFATSCIPVYEDYDDNYSLAIVYNNIGICHKSLGKYDEALASLGKALANYQELDNEFRQSSTLYNIASVYELQGNDRRMAETLLRSKTLIDSVDNLLLKKQVYQRLGEVYFRLGENKRSADYYNTFSSFVDTLYFRERSEIELKLEAEFNLERKDKEIAQNALTIEKQNSKLAASAQKRAEDELVIASRNSWIYGLIGAVSVLLLLLLYIRQRSQKKLTEERERILIQEKEKRLAAMIQVQDTERKRIASDLHDGIVQQLGGLKLGLQKEFSDHPTENNDKLVHILDEATTELRELSHRMMPRALTAVGLIPALEDMLDNSLAHTKIEYKLEHFGGTESFTPEIELTIFRTAQELIQNVMKHSQASHVNIQLFSSAKHIALIVEDNGVGINTEKASQGIGLMNISSRVESLGGKVNFERSPENGTLVTIQIPHKK